jgi:hypothetical protein
LIALANERASCLFFDASKSNSNFGKGKVRPLPDSVLSYVSIAMPLMLAVSICLDTNPKETNMAKIASPSTSTSLENDSHAALSKYTLN